MSDPFEWLDPPQGGLERLQHSLNPKPNTQMWLAMPVLALALATALLLVPRQQPVFTHDAVVLAMIGSPEGPAIALRSPDDSTLLRTVNTGRADVIFAEVVVVRRP